MALGVVALARPQWGEKWIDVQHMGLDILVVLDTSNSTLAEDVRPNRMERAKLGVRELVSQLRGDRIGLIPFAGGSYLYCPLTTDYGAFLMMLDDVRPGLIPRGGTAIEQALHLAIESFDDQLLADRVIILITDGEDHEGDPLRTIDEMRRRNIRLFAVGVGTPEGDLIPIPDGRGGMTFLRDRQGQIVRTRLEEATLERLATRTGGLYVRATPGEFGLRTIYEQGIAPLQRDRLESERLQIYEERFALFLIAALLLLVFESLLPDGKRRARGLGLLLVITCLSLPHVALANNPQRLMREGLREFREAEFEAAAEAFRVAAEEAEDTRLDPARAKFNYANALFAKGDFEGAARAYQEALRSTDLDVQQRAHFNRGNALLNRASSLAQEQQFDTAKALTEQALESYRNAITLDPRDRDAKINHEWADRFREQLEEILAQQPPPPQQQPDQDDQQQDEDSQDDEGDAPPEPADAPEPQPDDDHDPGEDEQRMPPEGVDPMEADAQPMPESMDEMTEEEAMLLLDAMRAEEQETRDQMQLRLGPDEGVEKDW